MTRIGFAGAEQQRKVSAEFRDNGLGCEGHPGPPAREYDDEICEDSREYGGKGGPGVAGSVAPDAQESPIKNGATHSLHWHKICREAIAAGRGRSIAFTHQTQSILYTDGVYGVLSGTDVKGEISELGKAGNSSTSDEVGELKALVKQLLLKLGENEIG